MDTINVDLVVQLRKFIWPDAPDMERIHSQGSWMVGKAVELSGSHLLDQRQHICGTAGCVAGWGALVGGYHQCAMFFNHTGQEYWQGLEEVVDEQGIVRSMSEAAAIALNLNYNQASYLFSGSRTHQEIMSIFDAIEESGGDPELNFPLVARDKYTEYIRSGQ